MFWAANDKIMQKWMMVLTGSEPSIKENIMYLCWQSQQNHNSDAPNNLSHENKIS
jgi:menaquinone-dependent protoporphyrinogen IX oxidase